jgi:hypothetical protein
MHLQMIPDIAIMSQLHIFAIQFIDVLLISCSLAEGIS